MELGCLGVFASVFVYCGLAFGILLLILLSIFILFLVLEITLDEGEP